MLSRISKSHSKQTLHSEQAGEMQKNNCPRCNGTRLIETCHDIAETHKVTTECPLCLPDLDLQSLRSSGL